MSELIEPRLLKGFRDFLPDVEGERQHIKRILEEAIRQFGFVPIDTPVLEYAEILLGKGGGETDKQVYRFSDQGKRDVAMRYDLTVPFARFMAAHQADLYLPFKRYHIGKAWRGENTQRGRYREFMQCDFDIVGTDAVSADLEIVLLMHHTFRALGVNTIEIHISDRSIFNELLATLRIGTSCDEVLRTVDKLRKIGREKVGELLAVMVGTQSAGTIMRYIEGEADNNATLSLMADLAPGAIERIERLRRVIEGATAAGAADVVVADPAITRGLDYYTGIVFETFLTDLPGIGSVCSGGRYDNLASLYTKTQLPGVGASIGIDRLMAALQEIGITTSTYQAADVMVACLDEMLLDHYHTIAATLRGAGLSVDVYPDQRKLGQQFEFAERKGIAAAVICGEGEQRAGTVNVRDLRTRENTDGLTLAQAVETITAIVERS